MTDQMDDLMKAAEACVAEATPETLEPGKLRLVKGEFSSLEEALRAQVQLMQEKSEKLLLMVAKRDEKIQDLEILVEGHRETIREYKLELKNAHYPPITFEDD